MNLQHVKVLITGGTSGIGLNTVEALVREQAHVIVVARNGQNLVKLAQDYHLAGVYQCDLEQPAEVMELGKKIQEDHPDLQILINNAGIQHSVFFDSGASTPESIMQEININFVAPLLLIRTLLPLLKKQPEAAILNVTTGLALVPKTSSAVYCGTKAGLRIFSASLRNQLEGTNVRVIEVLPPVVDTPMTAGRGRNKIQPKQVADSIIRAIKGKKDELYVDKTKALYWISRISPSIARRIMKKLG